MFDKQRYAIGSYFVDARRSSNNGKTLLLIHGIGVSGNYFMPFADILSRGYDVHVLDMPGYGDVPKPSKPLAPLEQADVIAGYVEKVGLQTVIIIGQSMGCQTAARFAARYPQLCEKVVLIGPTVNKWERRLSLQALRLLADTFKESFKMNLLILHDYIHMGVGAYLVTLRYMLADRIEETLVQVQVPVCIVRGKNDGIAPEKWVEYLRTVTKNAETHHIDGAPHNVQFIKPGELFAVCEAFLKK